MSGHLSVDGVEGRPCSASQTFWACKARATSAVSALRVLRNTVSRITRRPGGEPVGDAGLLGQQMEPQFPDLAAQVTGIGLAEVHSVLGKQADQEIDPAEITVGQVL
jgi:hypothetical protein